MCEDSEMNAKDNYQFDEHAHFQEIVFLCPRKMQHEEIRIVRFRLDIKKNILTNWITKCKSDHVIFLLKKNWLPIVSRSKPT